MTGKSNKNIFFIRLKSKYLVMNEAPGHQT